LTFLFLKISFLATTVSELQSELEFAIQAMLKTNYSSASVQSASELFLRFISMVTKEQLTGDVESLMSIYKKRGENFISRVGTSRNRISKFSRLFIQNNAVTLLKVLTFTVRSPKKFL
jgi:translation initiation factor 2B subunit (eIF-2B alpha/beta/delta family)